jgi:hypothetical protein
MSLAIGKEVSKSDSRDKYDFHVSVHGFLGRTI